MLGASSANRRFDRHAAPAVRLVGADVDLEAVPVKGCAAVVPHRRGQEVVLNVRPLNTPLSERIKAHASKWLVAPRPVLVSIQRAPIHALLMRVQAAVQA